MGEKKGEAAERNFDLQKDTFFSSSSQGAATLNS